MVRHPVGSVPNRTTTHKRAVVQPQIMIDNSTWEGSVAWLIREGLKDNSMDPVIINGTLSGFHTTDVSIAASLPDYYAKIFHRTKFSKGMVAVSVLKAMDIEQGNIMKKPSKPTTVTICPPKAAAATAGPTGLPCAGNQIQGTCTRANLPTSTPNSGPQPPVCNKVGSANWARTSDTKANDVVTQYCQNLINAKTTINAQNTSPKPGIILNTAENGGQLALTILFDVKVCNPGTSAANQKVDLGAMSLNTCFQNLYTNLAMICAQDSTWKDYNKDFPLEGGSYGFGCALLSISGEKP